MDDLRGFGDDRNGAHEDTGIGDPPEAPRKMLGSDERRMHVRAYNHWVSLLDGRPYPPIGRLDPESIADFGPHSVLLDFSVGAADPSILYLGQALHDESGVSVPVNTIADVPDRSLLARLTGHYPQVIANRGPAGFEAEFVNSRGRMIMYRGILMPFSTDGQSIDYVYGVVNWKELTDAATQAALESEIAAALADAPAVAITPAAAWADGPGAEPIAPAAPATAGPRAAIDAVLPLATVHLPLGTDDGYVLLLGRIVGEQIEIVADVTEAEPLADAIRRAA